MSPQKPRKRTPAARQRRSKRQAERNPMLGVRVPKALYTQLQQWAKADSRTLADWLRLNLPRLLDPNAPRLFHTSYQGDKLTLVAAGVQEPTTPEQEPK